MNTKERNTLGFITLALGVAGVAVICLYANWQVALSVVVLQWAQNIDNKLKAK